MAEELEPIGFVGKCMSSPQSYASEPKFKVLQIAEELRALARQERAA